MATVVEKVLEEVSRSVAKAVANVDVKGLAEKAGKGAGKEATGAGKAVKGVLRK